ncbi:hypothetical protein [Vibrio sp. HN007]|uniref:hypothetical protein n=1 Tax=Vibrio iocasae TaxID=3098914 RepID=UPI0035D523B6
MKKTLVEVKTLDKHICVKDNAIYLDGSIILTPSARDELNKRGVSILHGAPPESEVVECPADCTCDACIEQAATGSTEKLFYSVAAILKQDFGVEDVQQLQEMSCRIVNAVNKQ